MMDAEIKSIRDVLDRRVGCSRIRAAWFSTFTFDSAFFEREVLDGFLVPRAGRERGSFPVTVALDARHLEASGGGYDFSACGSRTWHAKVVILMLEEEDGSRRTLCLIGSGNLTPSGWDSNLELWMPLEWEKWRLPKAIERLVFCRSLRPAGASTAFGRWFLRRKSKSRSRLAPYWENRIRSSAQDALWNEWWWDADSWDEAIVVSPFLDGIDDDLEADSRDRGFFSELLGWSDHNRPRLALYLRDAGRGDRSVIADWKTICWLKEKFDLRVFQVPGRPLHAKLFLVRCGSRWSVLGGSPNASGAAMIRPGENIEVAWQNWGCREREGKGLLAPLEGSRPVAFRRENFVAPKFTQPKPRWSKLLSAHFDPRLRGLVGEWRSGAPDPDTEVLWDGRPVKLGVRAAFIGEGRALGQRPRKPSLRKEFSLGWAPVEWQADAVCEDGIVPPAAFLEMLSLGTGFQDGAPEVKGRRRLRSKPGGGEKEEAGPDFPWKERVDMLQAALEELDERCQNIESDEDEEAMFRRAVGMFKAADREARFEDGMERAFREWGKAEIYRFVKGLDRRRSIAKRLRRAFRGWREKLAEDLR